jgi:hypothetical protein
MSIFVADIEMFYGRPVSVEAGDVMCLIKRRAYELALAVPHSPHALAAGAQPQLYVRVKTPCQARGFALALEDAEQLYEDLLQMMAYMQNKRQKTGASRPL